MKKALIRKKLIYLLEDVETFLDEMKAIRDATHEANEKLLYRKLTSALDMSANRLSGVVTLMGEKGRGSPKEGPRDAESVDRD